MLNEKYKKNIYYFFISNSILLSIIASAILFILKNVFNLSFSFQKINPIILFSLHLVYTILIFILNKDFVFRSIFIYSLVIQRGNHKFSLVSVFISLLFFLSGCWFVDYTKIPFFKIEENFELFQCAPLIINVFLFQSFRFISLYYLLVILITYYFNFKNRNSRRNLLWLTIQLFVSKIQSRIIKRY